MGSKQSVVYGVQNGFYFLNTYFLLPEGYSDAAQFLDTARKAKGPLSVHAVVLREVSETEPGPYEMGVCLAPYFIADYLQGPEEIILEYPEEIYPVQVELLSQKAYNDRLRAQVARHCPGCRGFGALNESDSSLSGHFDEITLDGFCPYRWETRNKPREFLDELAGFGHAWGQFGYGDKSGDYLATAIRHYLKLSYASGCFVDERNGRTLELCARKSSVIHTALTDVLDRCVSEYWQAGYHIRLEGRAEMDEAAILKMLSPKKTAALRRELKKYGVMVAVLEYDPCGGKSVRRFLDLLAEDALAWILHAEAGKAYCLFTCEPALMHLRAASPMFEAYNASATVYDALKTVRYRIGYRMEREIQDAVAAEPFKEKKPGRRIQKAEAGRVLKRDQAQRLFVYLTNRLTDAGCDHTLRFTECWLRETLPPETCAAAIEEIQNMGGFCDCEVLMNCYEDYDLD